MHEAKEQPGSSERRYETRDVTVRTALYSAIGIVLLTVAGLAASGLVMQYFMTVQKLGPPASPFDNTRAVPPPPRLQVSPAETLKAFEAEEQVKLASYGWVDKNAGLVRIPIERAMELSLHKGFLTRTSQAPARSSAQEGAAAASISKLRHGK